jgi:hypothetical protein
VAKTIPLHQNHIEMMIPQINGARLARYLYNERGLDTLTLEVVLNVELEKEEIKERKSTRISAKTFRKLIELLVHLLWQRQRISPIPFLSFERPFLLKRNGLRKRAPRSSPHRLPRAASWLLSAKLWACSQPLTA